MPFKKGQSGNPGGRPKSAIAIRELAQLHAEAAIERLVYWMNQDDPRASVPAADKLLDRAYGKPAQPHDGDGNGSPIRHKVAIEFIRAKLLEGPVS